MVARFVGLDSDQQTSRKLLADAADRLEIARRRAAAAQQTLLRWRALDFVDENVAAAIAAGQVDISELRRLNSTVLTGDELGEVLSQAQADVEALISWLTADAVRERVRAVGYSWQKFERTDMPSLFYQRLARSVFVSFAEVLRAEDAERARLEAQKRAEEERRRVEEQRRRADAEILGAGSSLLAASARSGFLIPDHVAPLAASIKAMKQAQQTEMANLLPSVGLLPRAEGAAVIEASRYDDLVAEDVRAGQRVEDLEEELRRLRQQHADVVRPDARLWWAVLILTAYAIAGVAVPLWVMAEGPTSIGSVRWTFWPFAAGLTALLAYVVWYLEGLSRRRRRWAGAGEALRDVDEQSQRARGAQDLHPNVARSGRLAPTPGRSRGSRWYDTLGPPSS
jgi:hypothetical protein